MLVIRSVQQLAIILVEEDPAQSQQATMYVQDISQTLNGRWILRAHTIH